MLNWTATRTEKKVQLAKKQLAEHFFVHFFAVVLYDYNAKRPSYTFYEGTLLTKNFVSFVPVRFFFHCCSFSPCWPLAFLERKRKVLKDF